MATEIERAPDSLLVRDMVPAKVCPACYGSGVAPKTWPGEAAQVCPRCNGFAVLILAPEAPAHAD